MRLGHIELLEASGFLLRIPPWGCCFLFSPLEHLSWVKLMHTVYILLAMIYYLVGGFKYFLFSSLFGEDSHFD